MRAAPDRLSFREDVLGTVVTLVRFEQSVSECPADHRARLISLARQDFRRVSHNFSLLLAREAA